MHVSSDTFCRSVRSLRAALPLLPLISTCLLKGVCVQKVYLVSVYACVCELSGSDVGCQHNILSAVLSRAGVCKCVCMCVCVQVCVCMCVYAYVHMCVQDIGNAHEM